MKKLLKDKQDAYKVVSYIRNASCWKSSATEDAKLKENTSMELYKKYKVL